MTDSHTLLLTDPTLSAVAVLLNFFAGPVWVHAGFVSICKQPDQPMHAPGVSIMNSCGSLFPQDMRHDEYKFKEKAVAFCWYAVIGNVCWLINAASLYRRRCTSFSAVQHFIHQRVIGLVGTDDHLQSCW